MSLFEKISDDFKNALKAGEKNRVSILRMIKSAIKNKEIEKGDSLNDEEITAVLRSLMKQAKESIDQFSQAGRADLVKKEETELKVVQEYLPRQMSEEETREMIKEAIREVGAAGSQDMGKVMKIIMKRAKGQIDGKLANNLVREMLEE